jgi:hypothetical protein
MEYRRGEDRERATVGALLDAETGALARAITGGTSAPPATGDLVTTTALGPRCYD